jgi:formylglycine-generating enzyme required for sulfatase activity
VEVVKKGWLWDSKAIEKKVVKEKVVEVVKKKEIREKFRMSEVVEFNMVYCPAGEFWMGIDDASLTANYWKSSKPRHKVRLNKGFWMGETQVTQDLWQKVMGWNPSNFKGSTKLPVEYVTWYDCLAFCNKLSELEKFTPCFKLTNIETDGASIKKANVEWLRNANGYMLPTEAEWEYSAKAGTELIYSGSNSVDEVAWYCDNSGNKTHEVKGKKANAWGLYDMSGNVWEWCMDKWDENAYKSRNNGIENPILWDNSPCARVVRGGSFRLYADYCRVAYRFGVDADHRYDLQGLRLLRCEP